MRGSNKVVIGIVVAWITMIVVGFALGVDWRAPSAPIVFKGRIGPGSAMH